MKGLLSLFQFSVDLSAEKLIDTPDPASGQATILRPVVLPILPTSSSFFLSSLFYLLIGINFPLSHDSWRHVMLAYLVTRKSACKSGGPPPPPTCLITL